MEQCGAIDSPKKGVVMTSKSSLVKRAHSSHDGSTRGSKRNGEKDTADTPLVMIE
jgi:hypothetical protein